MTDNPNNAKAYTLAMHGAPWEIHPERMEGFLNTLIVSDMTAEEMEERTGPLAERVTVTVFDGDRTISERYADLRDGKSASKGGNAVAVVPLHGPITHRSGLFSAFFGGTSTEKFGKLFDELMDNPNIGAVVVDVDSPGGEVSGLEELAAKIFKARGTKPMVASANTWMASAAYRIGTAFDEVNATPSSELGSIGTYTKHADYSAMLENEGVTTTLISAGAHKTEFNPYEPLSEAAKAELQAGVDHYYGMFVKAVAKHRGVSAATVKNDFGQGRMIRAKDAVERGMADRVETLDETIRRVGGMLRGKARAKADAARRREELDRLEGGGA